MGGGKLGERGELVDEGAHRFDGAEDDVAAFADDAGGVGRGAIDVAADVLGGEGDGRERVPNLVRDALRDFFPGGLALRAEEVGDVFEDEDEAAALTVVGIEGGERDGKVGSATRA